MEPKTTKSGLYTIFHRDNCPFSVQGAEVPAEYTDPKNGPGPWFFQPTERVKTFIEYYRGYPMIYSPGYTTPEYALQGAEDWEIEEPRVAARYAASLASVERAVTFKL